jgi:hypothetical protein
MSRTGVAVETLFTSPQGSIISHPSLSISETRTTMPLFVMATVGASIVVVVGVGGDVVVVVFGAVNVGGGGVEPATASSVVVLAMETADCVVFTADRWVVLVGVASLACFDSDGAQAISSAVATPLRTTERVF